MSDKKKEKKFVYFDFLLDYCLCNDIVGFLGMLGRVCSSYDVIIIKCKMLCNFCGLKYYIVE